MCIRDSRVARVALDPDVCEFVPCFLLQCLLPEVRVQGRGCLLYTSRDNGIITGSADYAAEGLCILSNLSRSTLTKAND